MSIVGKETPPTDGFNSRSPGNIVSIITKSKGEPVISSFNCGKTGRGVGSMSQFDLSAISHCKRLSGNQGYFRPTVLDIGTGTGDFAACLVSAGARVVGVDRENTLSDAARGLCADRRITFIEKPIQDLPRRDLPRELSVMTAMRVLHWVPNQDAEQCLRLAASAMPTGSQLFFSVAILGGRMGHGYPFTEKTPLSKRYAPSKSRYTEFSHPVTLYTPIEAGKLAEKAGFNASRINTTEWGICNVRATREKKTRYFTGAFLPSGVS